MSELVNLNPDPATRDNVVLSRLSQLLAWARGGAVRPFMPALSCCGFEPPAAVAASSHGRGPADADVMILGGAITHKMAPRIRMLHEQMPTPRRVIALGACACGGGPYAGLGYGVIAMVEELVPVDVFIPGCPPAPDALLRALEMLHETARKGAAP